MVKAYDLVAIVCIINGPVTTNQGKRAMGMLDAGVSVRRVAQTFNVR